MLHILSRKVNIIVGVFTTRCQTRVCKNTKINFEARTHGKKLVFASKYFLGAGDFKFGA